jgi:hypothetical protein
MMHLAAARVAIGADATAVLVGVASSFVWLCVLFSIKPSLRLTWEEGYPGRRWWKRPRAGAWQRCSPRGSWPEHPVATSVPCTACKSAAVHYRVEIENLGLSKVVDIEVRLWRINQRGLASRTRIPVAVDQLLELNGKWQESRHRATATGNRYFHFLMPCAVSSAGSDQYLFQVQSKHGFTNFGRVQKLRITPDLLAAPQAPFGRFTARDPDARVWWRRGYAGIATVTAGLAISRHVHAYTPVGWYYAGSSAAPVTVVLRRCTCGEADVVTLSGRVNLSPGVPSLAAAGPEKTDPPGYLPGPSGS